MNNQNALLRYQTIDRCLRNRGRKWTWVDLRDEVNKALREANPHSEGIGKTTIYEDLKDIEYRIYNIEVERIKDGRTCYLRYADPNASINNQPLSTTESNQLKSAIQVLSRFKGLPQFEWVNEIIPAIESRLGLVPKNKQVIGFETNEDYEGLIHITALFNAIINERVLKITYQDFKSPVAYDLTFHPYYLKQFNSRWFVFGHNPDRNNIVSNLALDRIKNIEEASEVYLQTTTNWDDYFSDFIGVSRKENDPLLEIKLLIKDAEQAAYIKTKPLHQSQKQLRQVEGGFVTSIKVIPNYELEKLILSFGERLTVLSPESFRERIRKRIEDAWIVYQA